MIHSRGDGAEAGGLEDRRTVSSATQHRPVIVAPHNIALADAIEVGNSRQRPGVRSQMFTER